MNTVKCLSFFHNSGKFCYVNLDHGTTFLTLWQDVLAPALLEVGRAPPLSLFACLVVYPSSADVAVRECIAGTEQNVFFKNVDVNTAAYLDSPSMITEAGFGAI